MTGRTNVSRLKPFAYISVEYPEGSTCTCTDSTTAKVLTAENTDGKWVFEIPYEGTWTVSSTNSTSTASKEIEIDTELQVEFVTLTYTLILFDNQETTDVFVFSGSGSGSITDHCLYIPPTYAGRAQWTTIDTINLTPYSTLHAIAKSQTGYTPHPLLFYGPSRTTRTASVDVSATTFAEYTIDVSSVTSSEYVGIYAYDNAGIYAQKIWLTP